ncbi:MAG TPA: DegT/DnrJ/EryC1/StrS family aminotransferase [bacterium]|nr:DegT/DnrJ/EryC1/StrS family aminotransferase [bacterium]
MNDHRTSRRKFLKYSSLGVAGLALSGGSTDALYAGLVKKADTPAMLGGAPVRTKPFPEWPETDQRDVEMYLEAFREQDWSQFRHVESESMVQFEQKFADLMGTNYCASTNAGTTALTAALHALDVGPGDEVIVPTNTFIATAQAVLNNYALAVYVDSDPDTFMIDADLIEKQINANTKAILPVHIGGGACDMDKIMALSEKYDIPVLEDACQAHMGEWRGEKLGSVGTLGCFSFQEFKSLTSGEGGAIIGDDEALMRKCIAIKNNGRDPRHQIVYSGSNYRMTAFQVAVVRGQMRHLEEQTGRREQNAAYLETLLAEVPGISPAKKYDGQTRRAYYGYYLHYDKSHFNDLPRRKFREAVNAEGIPIREGCDTLNRDEFVKTYLELPTFRRVFSEERISQFWDENHCPANDRLAGETGLSFGQHIFLGTREDIEDVVAGIVKVQQNSPKLVAS